MKTQWKLLSRIAGLSNVLLIAIMSGGCGNQTGKFCDSFAIPADTAMTTSIQQQKMSVEYNILKMHPLLLKLKEAGEHQNDPRLVWLYDQIKNNEHPDFEALRKVGRAVTWDYCGISFERKAVRISSFTALIQTLSEASFDSKRSEILETFIESV